MNVRDAKKKAKELHALTDQLNEDICRIEQAFAAHKLGVSASVRMSDEELLVFKKSAGGWRFEVEAPDGSYCLLVQASRDTRLRAIDFFGPLFSELVAEAARTLARVEKANEAAKEFVDVLNSVEK